jgi:putative PIN family toxin of toxin-antitoxin system
MTLDKPGFVVDNNVLISRLLLPGSKSALAVSNVLAHGRLLVSSETLAELAEVLGRAKFDQYVSSEERQEFLRRLSRVAEFVHCLPPIKACRDPKDDKFLALAVGAGAKAIISGDQDLLTLHPFRGIDILTPACFIELDPS